MSQGWTDPDLDDGQREIQQLAHDFAGEVLRPASRRLERLGAPHESEQYWEVLAAASELGLPRMALPEEAGGLGLDLVTVTLVAEELGWGDAGFAATILANLALLPVALGGAESLRRRVLEPFVSDRSGRYLVAGAMTEPSAGSDCINFTNPDSPRLAVQTLARRCGEGFALTGRKCFTTNGGLAKVYVVLAREDPERGMSGAAQFVVSADSPGVSIGRYEHKLGWRCAMQGELELDAVVVPADARLPMPMPWPQALEHGLGFMAAITAAVSTGIGRAAYETARDYARERIQGGRPIAEHQAVARELAEMAMLVETAHQVTMRAARLNAAGSDFRWGCWAKVFCSDVAARVANAAVQLLGGYGVMEDFPAEKYLRDALVSQVADGANGTLRLLIGSRLP